MKLTLEDVRRVAELARLPLTPDEEARLQRRLSAVLDAVELLSELDTSQVEPTAHVQWAGLALRADAVVPSPSLEPVLRNAPATEDTRFAVPKVIE